MIAILKYNAGNIKSVQNAIQKLGYDCVVTDDPGVILTADKVILPGVGEASTAMQYLKNKGLDVVIKSITQPVLGICLGLQLMCQYTEEGNTTCLGIFDADVKLFPPREKVPNMGWNNLSNLKGELFTNLSPNDDVYFVHSYYAELNANTIASCNYVQPFSAALQNNNFYATQFHPEKSAGVGAQLLKNFLEL